MVMNISYSTAPSRGTVRNILRQDISSSTQAAVSDTTEQRRDLASAALDYRRFLQGWTPENTPSLRVLCTVSLFKDLPVGLSGRMVYWILRMHDVRNFYSESGHNTDHGADETDSVCCGNNIQIFSFIIQCHLSCIQSFQSCIRPHRLSMMWHLFIMYMHDIIT